MKKNNKLYSSLLVFFFTAVFLGGLPSVNFFKNIRLFVVKSGSMVPSIYPGSLIVVKKAPEYFKEDIITFLNPDKGTKELTTTTHRIQLVLERDSSLAYMTKGDANVFSDQNFVEGRNIIGKTMAVIPLIGFLSDLIKSRVGLIFFILIPGFLIISHEVLLIAVFLIKKFQKN